MDYLEINKKSWNKRLESHLQSDFYDVEGFLKGNSSLNSIELELLGDIKGLDLLHLQCHFGQDTISLNRLGANTTGIDLSNQSIQTAKDLAIKTNSDSQFICCDLYDLPKHLDQQFDIVFTSYGTISWMPDLDKWAKIISRYLKPNGKFVFVEFHPIVWMFDDNLEKVAYPYSNKGPIVETETGTYADQNADIESQYVNWNHGLGEVVNSLIQNGLEINLLNEYDYSPYNILHNSIEVEPKKFRAKHFGDKVPMVFSIVATKK